jgi:hypothetical protein
MKSSIETSYRLVDIPNVTLIFSVGDSNTVLFDKDIINRIETIVAIFSEDKVTPFKSLIHLYSIFKPKNQ